MRFGMDHPISSHQLIEHVIDLVWRDPVQLSCLMVLSQGAHHFPAQQLGQYPLRVEEVAPGSHKVTLLIDRPARDQTMQVDVLAESLAPGVQHRRHAELALKLAVASAVVIQAFPDTAKQAMVNDVGMALCPAVELMRQA